MQMEPWTVQCCVPSGHHGAGQRTDGQTGAGKQSLWLWLGTGRLFRAGVGSVGQAAGQAAGSGRL